MSLAAKYIGSPMTSFVRYTNDPDIFDIRHFSPDGKENHVCGHATLAATEHLAYEHPEYRRGNKITFRLNPKYAINKDNEFKAYIKDHDITLTMPAITELESVNDPAFYTSLADALRINKNDIVQPAFYAPRIINYVVALKDTKTLLSMKPDFKKLTALATSEKFPHEGVMATTQSDTNDYDIFTRVFLPVIGVDEDIACGSSNCSIIPYWSLFRGDVFAADKQNFKVLFPYPPGKHENKVGGVQDLHVDLQSKSITITGQASFQKTISLASNTDLGAPPRPS